MRALKSLTWVFGAIGALMLGSTPMSRMLGIAGCLVLSTSILTQVFVEYKLGEVSMPVGPIARSEGRVTFLYAIGAKVLFGIIPLIGLRGLL